VPAAPGAAATQNPKGLRMQPMKAANRKDQLRVVTLQGLYHVHPAGGVLQGQRRTFTQKPSGPDLDGAAAAGTIDIVVGAGNSQVFFHDGTGVIAKMPLKTFRNLK